MTNPAAKPSASIPYRVGMFVIWPGIVGVMAVMFVLVLAMAAMAWPLVPFYVKDQGGEP